MHRTAAPRRDLGCIARRRRDVDVPRARARYLVLFSGVHREDATTRYAEFVTLDVPGPTLDDDRPEDVVRFLAVAHDCPSETKPGEFNRWQTICERVSQRDLPPVNFMLHVGGQVEMKRHFEEAWILLKRGVEHRTLDTVLKGGVNEPWILLVERATEILRGAYPRPRRNPTSGRAPRPPRK